MTKWLMIFLFSTSVWGQSLPNLSPEEKAKIQAQAASLGSISKEEIEGSLTTLIKQGVISPDQAAQAREALKKMNQQDIDQLKEKSLELIK